MKYWKCNCCGREREYDKKLVMKICHCCQIPMKLIKELKGGSND